MRLGLSKLLFKIYKLYRLTLADIHVLLFGFEHVNHQLQSLDKRIATALLQRYGAQIGENCDIESPIIINTKERYGNLVVGNGCYIGKCVILDIKGGIELEDSVTISFGVTITSHLDVGKSPLADIDYSERYGKVILRRGSYVGANATIVHGVTIGECGFVCAGAVVTKDVSPYTMVGGVPARAKKKLRY